MVFRDHVQVITRVFPLLIRCKYSYVYFADTVSNSANREDEQGKRKRGLGSTTGSASD